MVYSFRILEYDLNNVWSSFVKFIIRLLSKFVFAYHFRQRHIQQLLQEVSLTPSFPGTAIAVVKWDIYIEISGGNVP